LRFLERREFIFPICDVLLICQDQIDNNGIDYPIVNLDMLTFNKSIMANRAVALAKTDKIVLLDGDRILPKNYFTTELINLQKRTMTTPLYHYKINSAVSDEQIEAGVCSLTPDFRYVATLDFAKHLSTKGLFSGNTILFKKDYEECGGMDESFEGYGFSDTDFMFTVIKKHIRLNVTFDKELHLWHPNMHSKDDFSALNTKNGLKFCKKWDIVPTSGRLMELYNGTIPFN
jgi:predicted glycosyltransferase involved in capsule biosynthesis